MRVLIALLGTGLLATASLACAQHDSETHPATDVSSTVAYQKAMHGMHHAMDISYSGDADADFVAGMIPHHQGAVDMAKIELQYGTDPKLKTLAKNIVAAQEKEIRFLQQWQKAHPAQH